MIFLKQQAPLGSQQAEDWTQGFPEEDLSRHGWSRARLLECFEKYQYAYTLQDNAAISIIFYNSPDLDILEVIFLGTVPWAQKQSHMYSLFKGIIDGHPKHKIWLECRQDNSSAIKLYEKLGFRESGRRPGYYNDGSAAILFNF
jgi:[ribosomal protein S18]-alanine N-acetyltransferase